MKVLNEPPRWSFQFDCRGCGARLEAEIGDVEWATFGADYTGFGGEKRYYVTCPCCEEDNFVPDDKLTAWVEKNAKSYYEGRQ